MAHDAGELARMLAANIASLVHELLPDGHREGAEWVHASLSGTSRRSLSVRLTGRKARVWSDFSSGEAGDALDLLATVLYRGDLLAAMDWARHWLGLADATAPAAERRAPPPPAAPGDDAEAAAQAPRRRWRRCLLCASHRLPARRLLPISRRVGSTSPSSAASRAACAFIRPCRTRKRIALGRRWWRRSSAAPARWWRCIAPGCSTTHQAAGPRHGCATPR